MSRPNRPKIVREKSINFLRYLLRVTLTELPLKKSIKNWCFVPIGTRTVPKQKTEVTGSEISNYYCILLFT